MGYLVRVLVLRPKYIFGVLLLVLVHVVAKVALVRVIGINVLVPMYVLPREATQIAVLPQ